MIRTRMIEIELVGNMPVEKELGWCTLAEVPVEKKPPETVRKGQVPPQPLVIKANDVPYFIIGYTWETFPTVFEAGEVPGAFQLTDSVLVLLVQKVQTAPTLVRAPANTLDKLDVLTGMKAN